MRALLPENAAPAATERALERFAASAGKEVWILVRHDDRQTSLRAADALKAALARKGISTVSPLGQWNPRQWEKALAPYRSLFVTEKDKDWLSQATDAQLLDRALRRLYRPFDASSQPFSDDPLGLFENALASVGASARFQLEGRHLTVRKPSRPTPTIC